MASTNDRVAALEAEVRELRAAQALQPAEPDAAAAGAPVSTGEYTMPPMPSLSGELAHLGPPRSTGECPMAPVPVMVLEEGAA